MQNERCYFTATADLAQDLIKANPGQFVLACKGWTHRVFTLPHHSAAATADQFRNAVLTESSISMAQAPAWGNTISDYLLQFLDLGKSSLIGPRPDCVAVDKNLENTSSAGHERQLVDIGRERR